MKIMFICTGNTCRSPMAEGIFKAEAGRLSLDKFEASSAGLAAFPGDGANENAVAACRNIGLDISMHRSGVLTAEKIKNTDIFFVMTYKQKAVLVSGGIDEKKIYLPGHDISDPYGGSLEVYEKCRDEIKREIRKFIFSLSDKNIVPMTEENAEDAAEIEKECFEKPWSISALTEEAGNELARFFVFYFEGAAAGYAGMHVVSGESYIDNIAVKEKYRGFGIGEALTKHLVSEAEKEKCSFITLEVRTTNKAAISLYEKLGFKKTGERKNFYSYPAGDAAIYTLCFR